MENNNSSGGITLGGALLIVFITLKLTGSIDWSWWWVLSPLWITWGLIAVVAVFMLIDRNAK